MNSGLNTTPTEKQLSIGANFTGPNAIVRTKGIRHHMSTEFLRWFVSQKPFRPFRLALKDGTEQPVLAPEYIGFNDTDTIRVVVSGGMHGLVTETIRIQDIMEIRQ